MGPLLPVQLEFAKAACSGTVGTTGVSMKTTEVKRLRRRNGKQKILGTIPTEVTWRKREKNEQNMN